MYQRGSYGHATFGFARPWTPMVKILILVNGGVFLAELLFGDALIRPFELNSAYPLHLWRYVSYLFLHSVGNPFHILFNMYMLWMFGSELEGHFGSRKFLHYYFFTGVGAGLSVVLIDLVLGQHSTVIGASGAVFGLLLAYGMIFGERLMSLIFPPMTLKARHMVILFGVVEFIGGFSGSTTIAHFAHLGGMAFGYLYLKAPAGTFSFRGLGRIGSVRSKIEQTLSNRDDRRMDDLLRKVNQQGIQSLTEEEKQFLHRMSRRKKWQ